MRGTCSMPETAAEHFRNAAMLLAGNEDEDRPHLLVLMTAARDRILAGLVELERERRARLIADTRVFRPPSA